MRPVALFCLAVAGCAGFPPPPPDVAVLLDRPRDAGAVRERALVTIESDSVRGEFEAVLVAARGPRVRVQLFPDVGGKVLDLLATPERIAGTLGRERVDGRAEDAPRGLLVFWALTLLEEFAPLTRERVRGARRGSGCWELDIAPVVPGLESRVLLDDDGTVLERRLRWRRVSWTWDGSRVVARGFSLHVSRREREEGAALDEGVFGAP